MFLFLFHYYDNKDARGQPEFKAFEYLQVSTVYSSCCLLGLHDVPERDIRIDRQTDRQADRQKQRQREREREWVSVACTSRTVWSELEMQRILEGSISFQLIRI